MSAIEWVVSASIAADPVSTAATPLATAASRFAATATTTVRTLASSLWVTASLDHTGPLSASRLGTLPGLATWSFGGALLSWRGR